MKIDSFYSGIIHVNEINLWSHVGVLGEERLLGQPFSLDFSIWLDIDEVSQKDDLSFTVDYSLAIKRVQELAFKMNCFTIEKFSEKILDLLEDLYGNVPIRISLKKCSPPVPGFFGTISIEKTRNF